MSHGPWGVDGSPGTKSILCNRFPILLKNFSAACPTCTEHSTQGGLKPQTGKAPLPSYRFHTLHTDFIELNMCEGTKYCLVIIDPFTTWVEIFPTAKADAIAVVKVLCREIILRFNIPKVLWSDNGSHFVNELITRMEHVFDIILKKSLIFSPAKT